MNARPQNVGENDRESVLLQQPKNNVRKSERVIKKENNKERERESKKERERESKKERERVNMSAMHHSQTTIIFSCTSLLRCAEAARLGLFATAHFFLDDRNALAFLIYGVQR